jgi:hypothetical protein
VTPRAVFPNIHARHSSFEVPTLEVRVEKRKERRPPRGLYTRISGSVQSSIVGFAGNFLVFSLVHELELITFS